MGDTSANAHEWMTFFTRDGNGEFPVTRGRFLSYEHALAFATAWNANLPSVGVPPITGLSWGFASIDSRESLLAWGPDDEA